MGWFIACTVSRPLDGPVDAYGRPAPAGYAAEARSLRCRFIAGNDRDAPRLLFPADADVAAGDRIGAVEDGAGRVVDAGPFAVLAVTTGSDGRRSPIAARCCNASHRRKHEHSIPPAALGAPPRRRHRAPARRPLAGAGSGLGERCGPGARARAHRLLALLHHPAARSTPWWSLHGGIWAAAPYALWVEIGTRRMAAQPYLRPALNAVRTAAADLMAQVRTTERTIQ